MVYSAPAALEGEPHDRNGSARQGAKMGSAASKGTAREDGERNAVPQLSCPL